MVAGRRRGSPPGPRPALCNHEFQACHDLRLDARGVLAVITGYEVSERVKEVPKFTASPMNSGFFQIRLT